METIFTPEYIFIQTNTLFISCEELSTDIKKYRSIHSKMISLEPPVLWEKLENHEQHTFLLHIDWNVSPNLLTIQFPKESLNLLLENPHVDSLGILVHFDPDTESAEQVVFITGIQDGLRLIL